jgi:hypothetical protein
MKIISIYSAQLLSLSSLFLLSPAFGDPVPPAVTYPGTAASYLPAPSDADKPSPPLPPPPPVYNPGTGASFTLPPSTVVNPGTGVSYTWMPSSIVYPGTGAAAYLTRTPAPEVVFPGTGVSYTAPVPAGVAPPVVYPGSGVSYVMIPSPTSNASQSQILVLVPASTIATPPVVINPETLTSSALPGISVPAKGIPQFNFTYLASHLRDCNLTYDELRQVTDVSRSPFCAKATKSQGGPLPDIPGAHSNNRLCERYDISQFPEVVRLSVDNDDRTKEICSATLIAYDWALTAAHCFVGDDPTSTYTSSSGSTSTRDFVWKPGNTTAHFVSAEVAGLNMAFLDDVSRIRKAQEVIVYGRYGGANSKPLQYSNDLALVHLTSPYLARDVEPAAIATGKVDLEATVGGYGFTNADGASIGNFNLGWPDKLSQTGGELQFSPAGGSSGFCQGDSGGLIFAHRLRGCKTYDVVAEPRPHIIEGVVSYNHPGVADADAETEAQAAASQCVNGGLMVAQDLTYGARRAWICKITNNAASGCEEAQSRVASDGSH